MELDKTPWIPWNELDLKKIIQADKRYDLFGTESLEQPPQPPQQYYVFWEEKTIQPIFWEEREWMYNWVVVTDVKTIGKNVIQYSIDWISQYWFINIQKQIWLPLVYIIPPEQETSSDQPEPPKQDDADTQQSGQPESEQDKQSDTDKSEPEKPEQDTESESGSGSEQSGEPEQDAESEQDTESEKTWWDWDEEWAEEIVKAGAKKVTPEELLTLPRQEFILAKRDNTTTENNISYHTVKIFDNIKLTWIFVENSRIKYLYSNEDGRVGQKKYNTYDKNWCLYWIAKTSW